MQHTNTVQMKCFIYPQTILLAGVFCGSSEIIEDPGQSLSLLHKFYFSTVIFYPTQHSTQPHRAHAHLHINFELFLTPPTVSHNTATRRQTLEPTHYTEFVSTPSFSTNLYPQVHLWHCNEDTPVLDPQ